MHPGPRPGRAAFVARLWRPLAPGRGGRGLGRRRRPRPPAAFPRSDRGRPAPRPRLRLWGRAHPRHGLLPGRQPRAERPHALRADGRLHPRPDRGGPRCGRVRVRAGHARAFPGRRRRPPARGEPRGAAHLPEAPPEVRRRRDLRRGPDRTPPRRVRLRRRAGGTWPLPARGLSSLHRIRGPGAPAFPGRAADVGTGSHRAVAAAGAFHPLVPQVRGQPLPEGDTRGLGLQEGRDPKGAPGGDERAVRLQPLQRGLREGVGPGLRPPGTGQPRGRLPAAPRAQGRPVARPHSEATDAGRRARVRGELQRRPRRLPPGAGRRSSAPRQRQPGRGGGDGARDVRARGRGLGGSVHAPGRRGPPPGRRSGAGRGDPRALRRPPDPGRPARAPARAAAPADPSRRMGAQLLPNR